MKHSSSAYEKYRKYEYYVKSDPNNTRYRRKLQKYKSLVQTGGQDIPVINTHTNTRELIEAIRNAVSCAKELRSRNGTNKYQAPYFNATTNTRTQTNGHRAMKGGDTPLEEFQKKYSELQGSTEGIAAIAAAERNKLKDHQQNINTFMNTLNSEQQNTSVTSENIRQQLSQAEAEKEKYNSQILEKDTEIIKLKQDIEKLNTANSQLKDVVTTYIPSETHNTQIMELNKQIDAQKKELEETIKTVMEERDKLTADLTSKQQNIDSLTSQLQNFTSVASSVVEGIKKRYGDENKELITIINDYDKSMIDLQNKLSDITKMLV
jgi:chromosome segregation ATPase